MHHLKIYHPLACCSRHSLVMVCLRLGPVSAAGLPNASTWSCAISFNDLDEHRDSMQFAKLWTGTGILELDKNCIIQ